MAARSNNGATLRYLDQICTTAAEAYSANDVVGVKYELESATDGDSSQAGNTGADRKSVV